MKDSAMQLGFDLWRIISQGGWVMAAIFLAGQAGWFFVLERWWHFRKMEGKVRSSLILARAAREPANPDGITSPGEPSGLFGLLARSIADARESGQDAMVVRAREVLHQHVPGLSRHLGTVAVLAGIAPLLGLAGTVTGIMQTFGVITLYGAGNPSMMAGGIAHALVVTEAGLVVAFPLLICHDLLQKRADAIEDDCVAGATRLIRLYAGKGTPA